MLRKPAAKSPASLFACIRIAYVPRDTVPIAETPVGINFAICNHTFSDVPDF